MAHRKLPGCKSRHTRILPEHEFRYAYIDLGRGERHVRYYNREVIGRPAWSSITYEGVACTGTIQVERIPSLRPAPEFTEEQHDAADDYQQHLADSTPDWW